MVVLANAYGLGIPRTIGMAIPEPSDPKYLEYLADDRQFMAALSAAMAPNHIAGGSPQAYNAIMDAAGANVANLTPDERAQIIQSARMIPAAGYRSDPTQPAAAIVRNIERMSNNQGYTGADAGVVVATTPTTSGYPKPISRGEVLDNENFGTLVDAVFTAAGGKSSLPASLMVSIPGRTGMPGDIFNFRANQGGAFGNIDLTKWSEAERIEFLNKVAAFGQDGTMSAQEHGELSQMAANFTRNGDNEPAAVTANNANGQPTTISKDDLMENGTFEKQLESLIPWNVREASSEVKALKDAIATADYDELSYEERVALVNAFNAANADGNATAAELAEITRMLEDFQTVSGDDPASGEGSALSNGLVVSNDDVAGDDNFMSMVNAVLDRSGVEVPKTDPNGYGGSFSNNQYTVPMLRGLNVSKLTPEQRIEVLEMISQAASDREVTRDEANDIARKVNELSGYGSYPFYMGYMV